MRRESGGGDGERERAGWNVGKGEAAVGGGDGDERGGWSGVAGEGDAGGGDGVSVAVDDEAGKGAVGGGGELRDGGAGKFSREGWVRAREDKQGQDQKSETAARGEKHSIHSIRG